ncbi:MAG: DHH family phosphoesterase, partial [Nanoarchaeota archaeon]
MLEKIKEVALDFVKYTKNKDVILISHNDTDGITSASIIVKCLKRLDRKFQLKIVKSLTPEIIYDLPSDKVVLFTDLASNSLSYIEEKGFERVFIIDHHEISQKIPKNVAIINPHLENNEQISSAGLCYLFAKSISEENKDLANLAIIGMIGDLMESSLSKFNNEITKDAEIVIKKGILLYPATRPINRVLEFSSEPYIPDVTGNSEGVLQLLREAKIERDNSGRIKSLIELDEEEMTRLVTAILLKITSKNHHDRIIGNIFLVKHFNKLEDAREISAKINAVSR